MQFGLVWPGPLCIALKLPLLVVLDSSRLVRSGMSPSAFGSGLVGLRRSATGLARVRDWAARVCLLRRDSAGRWLGICLTSCLSPIRPPLPTVGYFASSLVCLPAAASVPPGERGLHGWVGDTMTEQTWDGAQLSRPCLGWSVG